MNTKPKKHPTVAAFQHALQNLLNAFPLHDNHINVISLVELTTNETWFIDNDNNLTFSYFGDLILRTKPRKEGNFLTPIYRNASHTLVFLDQGAPPHNAPIALVFDNQNEITDEIKALEFMKEFSPSSVHHQKPEKTNS